ncbi:MAG: hypothetical protein HQL45_15730 [Alphaproteobacteria bacterium]|nr:hypothetical protein [Alphaproteobacteria bacterium]
MAKPDLKAPPVFDFGEARPPAQIGVDMASGKDMHGAGFVRSRNAGVNVSTPDREGYWQTGNRIACEVNAAPSLQAVEDVKERNKADLEALKKHACDIAWGVSWCFQERRKFLLSMASSGGGGQ